MRYAEIDRASGLVINIIVLNNLSDYDGTNLVIASDTANIGDRWDGTKFIPATISNPSPDILYLGNRKYTVSATEPDASNRNIGDYWDHESSGAVFPWQWNGTNWISRNLFQRDTLLISGQSITLTNVLVGLVTSATDDIPIAINPIYSIYITKLYAALRVPAGNLSNSNYWRLNLKNGAVTLQTLNVTAGDDAVTTGDVRKTSPDINIIYPKEGKYSLSLTQQGAPPGLRSPSALIEYRLVR